MSPFATLTLVVASVHLTSTSADAMDPVRSDVVVRVYDTTTQSPEERQASLDVAASIVSASIAVIWRDCDRWVTGRRVHSHSARIGEGSPCSVPLGPGELALRIVRSPIPPDQLCDRLPLGDAFLDARSGAGVLATIYFDRVTWTASQTGADRRVLLGRAIAHELGHLLLATTRHGDKGLMRGVWSRNELRNSRSGDWTFGPEEIAAIRARGAVRSTARAN